LQFTFGLIHDFSQVVDICTCTCWCSNGHICLRKFCICSYQWGPWTFQCHIKFCHTLKDERLKKIKNLHWYQCFIAYTSWYSNRNTIAMAHSHPSITYTGLLPDSSKNSYTSVNLVFHFPQNLYTSTRLIFKKTLIPDQHWNIHIYSLSCNPKLIWELERTVKFSLKTEKTNSLKSKAIRWRWGMWDRNKNARQNYTFFSTLVPSQAVAFAVVPPISSKLGSSSMFTRMGNQSATWEKMQAATLLHYWPRCHFLLAMCRWPEIMFQRGSWAGP